MRSKSGADRSWRTVAPRPITRTPSRTRCPAIVSAMSSPSVEPEALPRLSMKASTAVARLFVISASMFTLGLAAYRCQAAPESTRASSRTGPATQSQRRPRRRRGRAAANCVPDDFAEASTPSAAAAAALSAGALAGRTRNARTRYGMFFTRCSPMSSKVAGSRWRIDSWVAPEIATPPGSAKACSREATLTPSP